MSWDVNATIRRMRVEARMPPERRKRPNAQPIDNLNNSKEKERDDQKAKEKGKEKKNCCGFNWQLLFFVLFLVAIGLTFIVYFNYFTRKTYPAKLKTAVCVSDEDSPFFIPCKDRRRHNEQLMKNILDSANSLSDDAIARASVKYVMALAMRTEDIELEKELFEWMNIAVQNVECTKLISFHELDFQEDTPRGICAEAKYRIPKNTDLGHDQALADLNLLFDLGFLMSMYGSEFHDVALRYTIEGKLEKDGILVKSPQFAGIVHSYYTRPTSPPTSYSHLLHELTKRNTVEEERMGVHLLAMELEKMITVMRSCNPPSNITWNEYFSRAVFKSGFYEGKDKYVCGWTKVSDLFSPIDVIRLASYDSNFISGDL